MKQFRKRNIIFKLDTYRKFILNIQFINFYKNKIFLVCHSVYFSGYSLKLLREYLCSQVFEIYNYKDNFHFFLTSKKNENYLYNYKFQKPLIKSIYFFFNDFNEIYLFFYKITNLTLSPYNFYPLFIISPMKNVILPTNLFYNYLKRYKYKYYKNSFFFYIYINFIKKLILSVFIFSKKIEFK
jgi:hypothetical protein